LSKVQTTTGKQSNYMYEFRNSQGTVQ